MDWAIWQRERKNVRNNIQKCVSLWKISQYPIAFFGKSGILIMYSDADFSDSVVRLCIQAADELFFRM